MAKDNIEPKKSGSDIVTVSAGALIEIEVGETQSCWGVDFECVAGDESLAADDKGEAVSDKRLITTMLREEADTMVVAGRVNIIEG